MFNGCEVQQFDKNFSAGVEAAYSAYAGRTLSSQNYTASLVKMSSRAMKKLLRSELEVHVEDLEDSEPEVELKPKINPFRLLGQYTSKEESDRENDEKGTHEDAERNKEKTNQSAKSAAKKSKKKKAKKTQRTVPKSEEADLDALIAKLKSEDLKDMRDLSYLQALQVDSKYLDYEREYKQLFGKAAAVTGTFSSSINWGAGTQKLRDRGGRDGRSIPGTSRKLALTRIKDTFPPTSKRDILMEQLIDESNGDIKQFKFIHSASYMKAQNAFQSFSMIGDLDALVAHTLKETPYHVSTLLMLADVKTSNGQHGEAADLIEQCLLAYDKAFRSGFDLAAGNCRLPFRYFENRGFYLTIFKHLKVLMRRGTWRTAFEFNKLLWVLEPEEDPYGAGLMVDFFAINAGECQYILDLAENPYFEKLHNLRPNILYSRALAYYQKYNEDVEKITQYLLEAVKKFPWVAAAILGGEVSQSSIYTVSAGPEQAIYSGLYAMQMKKFWQGSIRDVLKDVCQRLDLQLEPVKQAEGVSLNVARFALLSEQTQVYSLIPKEYLSNNLFADDILPPLDDISPYTRRGDD